MRRWLFLLLVLLAPGGAVPGQDTTAGQSGTAEVDDSLGFIRITDIPERLTLSRRAVPDTTVRRLLKDDDYWYVAVGPRRKPLPPKQEPRELPWWYRAIVAVMSFFAMLASSFWGIALICGVAMALVVLVLQSVHWGSFWSKRRRGLKGETPGDQLPQEAVDPDAALRAAVEKGEYTQAVRLLFLQTLMTLAKRGRLKMEKDKTNREYLRELAGAPWSRDFARLVLQYEYTFYGGFVLGAPDFERVRAQFDQFQSDVTAG